MKGGDTLVTESKSVTRVHRCVRTEWNIDPPTSKSIPQRDKTLKDTGTLVYKKLASILKFSSVLIVCVVHFVEVLISLLGKPLTTFYSVRARHCTRVTDLNALNRSTHYIFYCDVHIFINEVSVKSLSSAIAE
ncbi:hypothetical protein TNCV_1786721 [Trichonephila clavipes]|nr:hypothetical protein TNCV_1786721 [Trichonephila clavipes]